MTAADFILRQPWAMMPDRVAQLLAIADRVADNEAELEAVLAKAGQSLENTRNVEVRDGVAVIPVRGVISRYANLFHAICGGTSVQVLAKDIRTAVDDASVHAIILEIDSPGGQVAGIGELAAQVREATSRKPVVAYVSNLGASAGYWIASAGSEVVAAPSAILGSVGVVSTMPRTTPNDRTTEFVSSQSPNKRLSTETEAGRAKIQAEVDALADVFIAAVAEYRDTTPEKVVSDFGHGGVLIGQAAVNAGMADRLGSLEELISELSHGGPAGQSHPITRGGAAADVREDRQMPNKQSFAATMAAWFRGGMKDEIDLDAVAAGPNAIESTGQATDAAMARVSAGRLVPSARERELEAEIEALKARSRQTIAGQAATWFDAQVKAERVDPAERTNLVRLYTDMAAIDADSPLTVVGADGKTVGLSRLDNFKAGIEARPAKNRTKEQIPADAAAMKEFLEAHGFKVFDNAAANPSEAQAKEDAETLAIMLAAAQDA